MVKKKNLYFFIWRLIAVIAFLVWCIVFLVDVFLYKDGYAFPSQDVVPHLLITIFAGVTAIAVFFLILFPLKFTIYSVLCIFWGLLHLVDGGGIPGIMMYVLGILFAYKSGFFVNYRKAKYSISALLLLFAICSQVRYGLPKLAITSLQMLQFLVVLCMLCLLFHEQLKHLLEHEDIIFLPATEFSDKDLVIISKIQNGEKYDTITREENIALSTLKWRLKALFLHLNVSDKTIFLSKYSNTIFKLEHDNKKNNLFEIK